MKLAEQLKQEISDRQEKNLKILLGSESKLIDERKIEAKEYLQKDIQFAFEACKNAAGKNLKELEYRPTYYDNIDLIKLPLEEEEFKVKQRYYPTSQNPNSEYYWDDEYYCLEISIH